MQYVKQRRCGMTAASFYMFMKKRSKGAYMAGGLLYSLFYVRRKKL